jgi:hypothetical protein
MAINVSFNGATIMKPGSYSRVGIDLGGGFPLSATGIVAIFGESDAGRPGAEEADISQNVFSPEQLPAIRQKYGRGPLVDACNFLFAPGSDGAIPGGASAVYIYKTNSSVRATLTGLATNWGTLRALEYGTGGNKLTYKATLSPASPASATHTGTFDLTVAGVGTQTLVLRVNGSANYTFTSPGASDTDTVTKLQTELNNASNWSPGLPSGITLTVGGTNTAATLTITRSTSGTPHKEGAGRNFEVVGGSMLASFPISTGLKVASSEDKVTLTISNKRDLVSEEEVVGGEIILKIGRNGGITPQVTINATQILLIENSVNEYVINKSDFATISELVDFINASTNGDWSASAGSTLYGQLSPSILDRVTALGANGSATIRPAQIKRDAERVRNFFSLSQYVELSVLGSDSYVGLPSAQAEIYFTGGLKGATSSAEISNALAKFEKIRVNSIVPLFSRDASEDFADLLTESGSTYTIDAIHQAVKTHLSLMATTKKRSERQGYLSIKSSYADAKEKAQNMATGRIQMVIQDIRSIDSEGNIKWFLPWAGACLLAGARGGSPVGTPMTFKFFNMSGIRHTAQPMSTDEQNIVTDFDPDTQFDDAIQNGITFWERPQTGGFRLVVDNTTYGRDGNWVYNRAHVQYAADIVAFDFRTQLENIYTGVKNTVTAAEIRSTCESILSTYLAQGITVSTTDAPNGFKQLTVQINGNTVNISVVVKLVESIDFLLVDVILQRAQSEA